MSCLPGSRGIVLLGPLFLLVLIAGCSRGASLENRLERADRYGAAGDFRAALIEARGAILKSPDDVRARAAFVTALYRAGQVAVAAQELQRIAPAARSPALAMTAAQIAVDLGEFESALEMLRGMAPASGAEEGKRAILEARALAGVGRLTEARERLSARARSNPRAAAALARILMHEGDLAAALEITSIAATAAPHDVNVLVVRGQTLSQAGQMVDAERAFTAAIDPTARPDGAIERLQALDGAIQTRLALGRVEDAERALGVLEVEGPNFIATAFFRGAVAFAKRDYVAASSALNDVVRSDEGNAAAWRLLGDVQFAQGNLSQAENSLRHAVAAAPENLAARRALAEVQIRLSRPSEAVEVLAPALEQAERRLPLDAYPASTATSSDAAGVPAQFALHSERYGTRLVLLAGSIAAGHKQEALVILHGLPPQLVDSVRVELAAAAMPREFEPAFTTMRDIADSSPQDAALQLLAASFARRAGSTDLAEVFLRRALAPGPLAAKAGRELTALLVSLHRLPAARKVAATLSERSDSAYEGAIALALVESASRDADAALRLLDTAARLRPAEAEPQFGAAQILFAARRADEAVGRMREIVAARPQDALVRLTAAELLIRGGQPKEALTALAMKNVPQSLAGEFTYAAGRALVAAGDLAAGRRQLEEARRMLPGSVQPSMSLVLLQLREGHVAAALKAVRDIETKYPLLAAPFVLEGEILVRMKEYSNAADAYSQAARLGVLWQAAVREFQVRALAGDKNAEAVLVRWLATRPADAPVRRILAARYAEIGRRELAIAQYERLAIDTPDDVVTLNNLAWHYHEAGDGRALRVARQASALSPDSAQVNDTLGWILVEDGSIAEGLAYLQAALAAAPSDRIIRGHVGLALYKAGEKHEAVAILSPLGDAEGLPERERIAAAMREAALVKD